MTTLQTMIIIILLSFILLGLVVVYLFFSINELLHYSNNCIQSNLWDYLLLSVIFICIIQLYVIISKKNTLHTYFINFTFIISLVMIVWGIYELFFINCVNKHNIIYNLSIIFWVASNILFLFILYDKIKKIAFTT